MSPAEHHHPHTLVVEEHAESPDYLAKRQLAKGSAG